MDVGFYLGELLMRQGEVSVPGLGYFVQARMSGYYDENEGKFYPPYHQAQFDPQSIDDDSLAEYIANKKNISVSSAKYFSEKYIAGLKQQALINEVAIGNLGWFYTELTQLKFKPAHKIVDDTVFYGLEPIKINKGGYYNDDVNEQSEVEPNNQPELTQSLTETPAEEPIETQVTEQPIGGTETENDDAEIAPEFFEADYEDEERKSPLRLLLIIFTVIVILGVAAFALSRYRPDVFEKLQFWKTQAVVVAPVKPKVIARVDTVATDTAAIITNGTVQNKPIDTLLKERYELIATSFKTMVMANKTIKNFKSIGIDAHVVTDAPGRLFKISVGTYLTRKEAETTRIKLVADKKIQQDAYTLPIIKPKQ